MCFLHNGGSTDPTCIRQLLSWQCFGPGGELPDGGRSFCELLLAGQAMRSTAAAASADVLKLAMEACILSITPLNPKP